MKTAELNPAVVAILKDAEKKVAALTPEAGNDTLKVGQLLSQFRSDQRRFGDLQPEPKEKP